MLCWLSFYVKRSAITCNFLIFICVWDFLHICWQILARRRTALKGRTGEKRARRVFAIKRGFHCRGRRWSWSSFWARGKWFIIWMSIAPIKYHSVIWVDAVQLGFEILSFTQAFSPFYFSHKLYYKYSSILSR